MENRGAILRDALGQADRRYESGLTDYLAVLSVTQQLYAVEQRTVRERRNLMGQRLAQYIAMGGPMPDSSHLPVYSKYTHERAVLPTPGWRE
ncbi:MAG: hypothetical protein J6386_05825 [Candidatus Synoicihabitans palmerolidicus]|nr:hypothetical protein [Candidatus Synoicihabitans palmerolidicus]